MGCFMIQNSMILTFKLPDTRVFERLADFPDACVDIVQFSCVRMDLAKDTVLTDTKTHVLSKSTIRINASTFIFIFFKSSLMCIVLPVLPLR